MKTKTIAGIVLVVLGIGSLLFSHYITTQVREGKLKIHQGQKSVDQSSQLFSANPATKEIGKGLTGGAQRKIDAGKQQVRDYEAIARNLEIGGIIAIILGGVLILVGVFEKGKKKR